LKNFGDKQDNIFPQRDWKISLKTQREAGCEDLNYAKVEA